MGGREKSERSSSALGRVINNGFVGEGELTVHLLGMPVEESEQEAGAATQGQRPHHSDCWGTDSLSKSPSAGTSLSFISLPFAPAHAVSLPGAAKPRSFDIINSAFC